MLCFFEAASFYLFFLKFQAVVMILFMSQNHSCKLCSNSLFIPLVILHFGLYFPQLFASLPTQKLICRL